MDITLWRDRFPNASGEGTQDNQAPPQTSHLSAWNDMGEVYPPQLDIVKELSPIFFCREHIAVYFEIL